MEQKDNQKTVSWRTELLAYFDDLENEKLRTDFESKYDVELADKDVCKFVADIYHALSADKLANVSFFVANYSRGFYIQSKGHTFCFLVQTINKDDHVVTGFYKSNRYSSDMNKEMFNKIIEVLNE